MRLILISYAFGLFFFQSSSFAFREAVTQGKKTSVECKEAQQSAVEIPKGLDQDQSNIVKSLTSSDGLLKSSVKRKSNEEVIQDYLSNEENITKTLVLGCNRESCLRKNHKKSRELTLNWDDKCDTDLVLDVRNIWGKSEKISQLNKIFSVIVDEDCCPIPNVLDEAAEANGSEKKEDSEKNAKTLLTHLRDLLGEDGIFIETTTGCGHDNSDKRSDFINKTGFFKEIQSPFERHQILKKAIFNQSHYSIDLTKEQVNALCTVQDQIKKYTDYLELNNEFLKKEVRRNFTTTSKDIPQEFQPVIRRMLDCITYTQMIQITGDHSLITQELTNDERKTLKMIKDRLRVIATPKIKISSLKRQIIDHNEGDESMYCADGEEEFKLMRYLTSFCKNTAYGIYRKIN